MAYRIVFSQAVRAQLSRLPGHIKPIAKQEISRLGSEPRPARSKELSGHPGYYRLWLGRDYRLVWYVSDDDGVVEVEYVGPKPPDLYEWLGLKRPSEK